VFFLIVNIIVIELSIKNGIFPNSSLFKNAEKHLFFILLIDADGYADGLFPRLIRSHFKAIAIKVSYEKKYNCEPKKRCQSRE